MNFKTAVILQGKIYKFLEKLGLEDKLSLDSFIDCNMPDVLSRLQTYSKDAKIAVSGTNGKKTVVNLINSIFSENEKSFITNVSKLGKRYPVLTSIILDLARTFEVFGNDFEKDYYVMAMDEFELGGYFNSMKFDYLILNNLFSDQRDYCPLEEKREKIREALVLNSKTNLIINADDPMFYKIDDIKSEILLNKKRNKFFFGFEKIEYGDSSEKYIQYNDMLRCPICGCKLDYKKRFYSHLGQYDCECGFKRPKLDISANAKVFYDYIFLDVFYNGNKYVFRLPFGGVYNAYNTLAAISLAYYLGIERKTITSAFDNYSNLHARDEIIKYKERNVKIKVIKNSTALSEATRELYGNKNSKAVFCLNDDNLDGIDTSWIWGANLDSVKNFENKVYVCANRFDDMALRLKYAGVNPCLIVMDNSIKNTIKSCYWDTEEDANIIIFATPSVLDEIYRTLK